MMEIEVRGSKRKLKIMKFSPMEGWEINDSFTSFASSISSEFRRAYVLKVLGFARILVASHELPLSTSALIDNHLGSVENVEKVFNAVLEFNGIDISRSNERSDYSTAVANEIATSFVSSCLGAVNIFIAHFIENNKHGR